MGDSGPTLPVGWRVARAFRWRPGQPCEADDLTRVLSRADGAVLAMANAGESGFSTCWAPGSRLALSLFEVAVKEHGERVELEQSFGAVSARFAEAAKQAGRYWPEDDLGGPHATLTAVVCSPSSVRACWIGGDGALLVRGVRPVWATVPHDLREDYRAAGTPVPDDVQLPDVVVRCISEGTTARPDSDHVGVLPGDTLVIANSYVRRRVSDDAIVYLASVSICPQEIADDLTLLAYESGDAPVTAAIVARREHVDVSQHIKALIERYEHDGTEREQLEAYARHHQVLPIAYDMGGAMGFDTQGRAVSVGWDDYDVPPRPLRNVGATLHMRQRLSAMHPDLVFLAPERGPALDCSKCGEWRASEGAGPDVGCPFCSYLGWVPPDPPASLWAYYGSVQRAAHSRDSPRSAPWWKVWKR